MDNEDQSDRGFHWIKYYFRDITTKTYYLDLDAFGAFQRLFIRICETQAALPNDDRQLARLAICDLREWKKVKPSLEPLFTVTKTHWHLPDLEKLISHQIKRNEINRRNGKKGADQRWHPKVIN